MDIKYNFKMVEKDKFDFWQKNNLSLSKIDYKKEAFSIVLPPPNITGKLHLGHAMDTTIADMVIRRKKMLGFDTIWLPGTDHAGIATQAKVDQRLKDMGISRFDIGRDKFLEEAMNWKDEYQENIHNQWKALGLMLDYSKERFTLDKEMSEVVNKVFIDLYNKGYIYRQKRIINWDPEAKTALSNIEVDHIEKKGVLYYINYKLQDLDKFITIATTRPETMFADTALMVNPNDSRYKDLIGNKVYIPTTNKLIPIISDSYVDKEYGTGCVKVTPFHDPNDYEVGLRHNLDIISCMDESGYMNEICNEFSGLERFECRKKLIIKLKELNVLVKEEEIIHSVGHSQRTNCIVEPRVSMQWFVKMDILAKQVLENKEYKFIPKRYKEVLERWLNNIQDWCISRQLWWGHRIPCWYKGDEFIVSNKCPGEGYTQDEDVLDTWFSSALWPFASMYWPNNSDLYKRYYPTSLLVTGYDIIFFWVSRMLFQGIEFTKVAPFKEIYIHGLVRDKDGRKMSKSLGNGIDPFDIIDKYGCDSLRYFLVTSTSAGFDLKFDEKKIEASWNYFNKIWNISRFVLLNTYDIKSFEFDFDKLSLVSKDILNKYNNLVKESNILLDKYEFQEAYNMIYHFIWDEFASWYLEFSKLDFNKYGTKEVLKYILTNILKILHPIAPFITEDIYLKYNNKSILESNYPVYVDNLYNIDNNHVDILKDIIVSIRNVLNESNIKNPDIIFDIKDTNILNLYKEEFILYINKFTKSNSIEFNKDINKEEYITIVKDNIVIYIKKITDSTKLNNLLKHKLYLEEEIKRSESILSNESFLKKAPEKKINEEKEKYNKYKNEYNVLLNELKDI